MNVLGGNIASATPHKNKQKASGNVQDAFKNPVTYEKSYIKKRISNLCAILFKT